MDSIIVAYENLSSPLQILLAIVAGAILIPIFSRLLAKLFVGCLIVAAKLGLIDWDLSGKETAKVDRIPDSSEKTALEESQCTEPDIGGKGRLEIEIEPLEERLAC
ncbi:hypothetical protein N7491_000401 [Penicillium cf. griseofulvum]|uniref:Uncharacterized protein n=1 Tax=Penicillium cf. griseofulvum TaxID=2972120 RepID=A0A9W9JSH7_9EURO|nr:hypothetical protein N7472_004240 [Penicillium cf. griseofulvum]KAJ5443330.1 hypothetical protein N7445_004443 [Penicillium cf. griseofulvum]KAJ5451219.1 hypothetical protein N7491_000401 [Penicillium cf. griseofulvum]